MRYRRIPLAQLRIDSRYQRPLEKKRVNRIAKNFDPRLLGALEVSDRGKDKLAVFDGQHRLAALRKLKEADAPCLVHEDLTAEQEAELFVSHQKERKSIHPVDRFEARRFAGDKAAVDISKAVNGQGYKIGHGGFTTEEKTIRAVSSLERIWKAGGNEAVRDTLHVVGSTWNGDQQSTTGSLLEGVHMLLRDYGDRLDTTHFDRLRKKSPTVILRRALGPFGGGGSAQRDYVYAELRKIAGVRGRPRKPKAAA